MNNLTKGISFGGRIRIKHSDNTIDKEFTMHSMNENFLCYLLNRIAYNENTPSITGSDGLPGAYLCWEQLATTFYGSGIILGSTTSVNLNHSITALDNPITALTFGSPNANKLIKTVSESGWYELLVDRVISNDTESDVRIQEIGIASQSTADKYYLFSHDTIDYTLSAHQSRIFEISLIFINSIFNLMQLVYLDWYKSRLVYDEMFRTTFEFIGTTPPSFNPWVGNESIYYSVTSNAGDATYGLYTDSSNLYSWGDTLVSQVLRDGDGYPYISITRSLTSIDGQDGDWSPYLNSLYVKMKPVVDGSIWNVFIPLIQYDMTTEFDNVPAEYSYMYIPYGFSLQLIANISTNPGE